MTSNPELSQKLLHLNPVSFTYKNDETNEVQYGLIDEEVNQILPEFVNATPNSTENDVTSIKYHLLPALLLQEIINLNKRIADLENKLNQHLSK